MDFLKDPRFSQYRSTTTMTKYFPTTNILNSQSAKQNAIYQFLKSNEPTIDEKHHILKHKQKHKQSQRKNTLELTNSKFFAKKTSQRLKTINSYFQLKKLVKLELQGKFWQKGQIQTLRKKVIKLNNFTTSIQHFQKSIKSQKQKVTLLSNYKTIVENHFQRFQVNQDRSRKQMLDHQQIIRLLQMKKSDDSSLAYFNAVQNKRLSQSEKNRVNSFIQKNSIGESSKNHSHAIIIYDMKINEYQAHCEERISQAIESLKKSKSVDGRGLTTSKNQKRKKENNASKNSTFHCFRNNQKQSRFFKQLKMKHSSRKENIPQKTTVQTRNHDKISKKNIKNNIEKIIFDMPISSVDLFTGFKENVDPKDINKQNQREKQFYRVKRNFQRRVKTAGPIQTQNNLFQLSRFSVLVQ